MTTNEGNEHVYGDELNDDVVGHPANDVVDSDDVSEGTDLDSYDGEDILTNYSYIDESVSNHPDIGDEEEEDGFFVDVDGDGNVVDIDDVDIPTNQSLGFAQDHIPSISPSGNKVWLKRSYLAPNETDNEFYLFKTYVGSGRGRTINYISTISQLSPHKINIIAQRNNWVRRVRAYDSYMLEQRLAESQDSRHEEHVRKLEIYREEQEIIGKQTSYTAGKILHLATKTLDKLITEDGNLSVDDLPKFLTVAAKLAETGKVLQSTALGVDQLMQALDETEDGN
jgi:hypothetical protein